jgi:hypothetical protein
VLADTVLVFKIRAGTREVARVIASNNIDYA